MKKILKTTIVNLLLITLANTFAFSLINCNKPVLTWEDAIERAYEIKLPENMTVQYCISDEPGVGKRARYSVFSVRTEPTEFLNSFKKLNADYPKLSDEEYITDPFSDEKDLAFEREFKGNSVSGITKEFYPDWDNPYLWKSTESPHDGLCIVYFPAALRLAILEKGH